MAIPASGAISFANLQTDLDGVTPGANPASISEYYAGTALVPSGSVGYPGGIRTAIPTSGAISLTNFYSVKWFGGVTYEYKTAGTYTVTVPRRPGFVQNYQWSCFLVGGGGGGGGAHGSTAPNRDPIGSGGGGGGGNHSTFAGSNNTATTLSFTIVVGAGGGGGGSSGANNPYTPKGSPGGTGGTSSLTINSVLQGSASGGGGGGGGSIEPDVGGTGGSSTTAYPGTAGTAGSGVSVNGGAGGDSVLSCGAYTSTYNVGNAVVTGDSTGKYGSGGQGGGGYDGTVYTNGGVGGSGYARVTFKNSISITASQTFATPTASGSFTVPAGIYQIYTAIVGAGGNNGSAGGYVEALITVTPGETLIVRVGGVGGSTATASTYADGGINGGGRGYTFNTNTAYGGSGYSGIFRSTTPLAIAGGAGGGGGQLGSGAGGLFSDSILRNAGGPGTTSAGGSPGGAYLTGGDTNATKNAGSGGGGGYYGGGGSGTVISGASTSGGGGSNYVISSAASLYNMSGFNKGGSWGGTYGSPGQGGRVVIYY